MSSRGRCRLASFSARKAEKDAALRARADESCARIARLKRSSLKSFTGVIEKEIVERLANLRSWPHSGGDLRHLVSAVGDQLLHVTGQLALPFLDENIGGAFAVVEKAFQRL